MNLQPAYEILAVDRKLRRVHMVPSYGMLVVVLPQIPRTVNGQIRWCSYRMSAITGAYGAQGG